MMQTPQTTPLADFLPYQLSITSNAVSARIAHEYRNRFALSVPEWRVMAVLGDSGPLTQRSLTRLTWMDKVAVNRACKVLEDRGLASREPNEHDGRSHLLDLTEDGRCMYGEIMPLAVELDRRIFANLDDNEKQQFSAVLERIRGEVEELQVLEGDSGNFGFK